MMVGCLKGWVGGCKSRELLRGGENQARGFPHSGRGVRLGAHSRRRPNDSPGRHRATSYAAADGYMSLPELFTWRSDYFVVP